jgi:membrane-bound lytic murein transglycosylase A
VRATNRSYVFFRIAGLDSNDEPAGAQGVPLHPGRSIAVDRTHIFGTPFFIEADLPIASARADTRFRRLTVAQDTGSAIVGPARADIYWGGGDAAAHIAGRIRQQGRFVMLLPRELDMVAAGRSMPMPKPKPPLAEVNIAKKNGEAPDKRQAGRTRLPDSPQAGAPVVHGTTAARLHRQALPPGKRTVSGHEYGRQPTR